MSLRLQILEEVSKRPRNTVAELCDLIPIASSGMSTQLSNLRDQGAIEVVEKIRGKFGQHKRVWTITARGKEILANPGARRSSKSEMAKPTLSTEIRESYKRSHAVHVELQRRAGISDVLIFGELVEAVSPAMRG